MFCYCQLKAGMGYFNPFEVKPRRILGVEFYKALPCSSGFEIGCDLGEDRHRG
jgi:hypothetical protein